MAEKIKKKTLWMRYVDFEKIKDMLHLIYENNGKLRAKELENLSIKKGILVKENGQPFTHTPRYHYRKVMENLELVEVKNRHYYISENEKAIKLLQLTDFNVSLSLEAKELLGEIILENEDCRRYFFDVFIDKSYYTLKDLRKEGTHVFVETKSMISSPNIKTPNKKKKVNRIILRSPLGKVIELNTQDEVQAIYWGVRLWALNLGITDEIMTSFTEGRIIYPINQSFFEEVYNSILNKIIEKVKIDKSDSNWILIYIPSLIKEVVLTYRFSISEIQKALYNLRLKYPSMVMFIPTSTAFIDIKTPYEKQDKVIRKLYLYKADKGYLSHIRIKKEILGKVIA